MKPNCGFVMAMLAMCSVTHVELVKRDMITADHIRLMDHSLTSKAKELLLDFASIADEKKEAFVCHKTRAFIESGLADLTYEERILVCRIYGSQGRELQISDSGMIVAPSQKVLDQKRREMKKQLA